MPPVSDVVKICRWLRGQPNHQASVAAITAALGISPERVSRAIDRALLDPTVSLHRAKGGTIKYRGSELGSTAGVYADVGRVVRDFGDHAKSAYGRFTSSGRSTARDWATVLGFGPTS